MNMMFGGGLMMGIGLLFMLLVIGIPILLVIALLVGVVGILQNQNRLVDVMKRPFNVTSSPVDQPGQVATTSSRYCAHCGAPIS
jgi:xanthosine utilization system XapX-like protein